MNKHFTTIIKRCCGKRYTFIKSYSWISKRPSPMAATVNESEPNKLQTITVLTTAKFGITHMKISTSPGGKFFGTVGIFVHIEAVSDDIIKINSLKVRNVVILI